MIVTIAIGGWTPKEVASQLESDGVDAATLWVCEGFMKGSPLEAVTMIRLQCLYEYEALAIGRNLAQAANEECAYVEFHDEAWLAYADGEVKPA